MRRFVKNRIIEYMEELLQQHKLLETAFLQNYTEERSMLSAGCQERAIVIGNTLEMDGAVHETVVKKLERSSV